MAIRPLKQLVVTNDMSSTWKNWMQQFVWFATSVQLTRKPQQVQPAIFMAIIGPEAIQIFNNFNVTEEEKKDGATTDRKFECYVGPKINMSFERYNIFNAAQKENETFDKSHRNENANQNV